MFDSVIGGSLAILPVKTLNWLKAERNIDVFIGDSTTDGTGLSGYKYGDYSNVQNDTWANLFCGKIMLNCKHQGHGAKS